MKHKITKVQYNSQNCFVCGLSNDMGLKAEFYETEDRQLIAVCRVKEEHQSYPFRLHGGVISAILDETIGRAISIDYGTTVWGVTMELVTRFKKPVPLDQELKAICRITRERGRFFEGTGELVLPDGTVVATAEGKYMKMSLDNITGDEALMQSQWGVVPETEMPTEIEI